VSAIPCRRRGYSAYLAYAGHANDLVRLDALANNAAIGRGPGSLADHMSVAFKTKATGPLLMLEAFAPLLKNSTGTSRVINVTYGAGSIPMSLDPKSNTYGTRGPVVPRKQSCTKYDHSDPGS
jgi:NAD(P)-dependent dehydrogenase (short-subunit alcohol dehydrogenase family)